MPLSSPTTDLSGKSNVNPSLNRPTEATAEDFQEISALFLEYKAAIEALELDTSPNPFYGRYTTLALLEQAYPTGELNAWAVIDAGAGITPQIAAWDDIGAEWEIVGAYEKLITAANFAALPSPGAENVLYITLDKFYAYIWSSNAYRLLNSQQTQGFNKLTIKEIAVAPATTPGPGQIVVVKNGSDEITDFIFSNSFTNYLKGYTAKFADHTLLLKIHNTKKEKSLIAPITAYAFTDGTNTQYQITVDNTIPAADVAVNDTVEIAVDFLLKKIDGGTL